ncbi:MAG: GspH/FimT family pseudopilin [Candidatus Thiodiazotropha sp. (ex Monitilora ramsayi)]|nr:GspH/FimT family pseudopilin [Candidatus Thiodiazotropha sp. (ex Monitilora ramsayi)]
MKKIYGMTLIELMVTLAVAIVVLGVGIPAFMNMVSATKVSGYSNDLLSALRLARSEATDGTPVMVCASNADQTGCDAANWPQGWLVYTDEGNDSGVYKAGEDEILYVWRAMEGAPVFNGATPNTIRYLPSGATDVGAQIQFAFKYDDCIGQQARQFTISPLGRSSIDHVACF